MMIFCDDISPGKTYRFIEFVFCPIMTFCNDVFPEKAIRLSSSLSEYLPGQYLNSISNIHLLGNDILCRYIF